MVEAGAADIVIELGMPFSDPFADGPVNQRGAERAIAGGTTLQRGVLDTVSGFRQERSTNTCSIDGLFESCDCHGRNCFCGACEESGVDGLLIVDMPPEEEAHWFGGEGPWA